jgi:two-component system cell cycle sensor histidine kinase/response regulator CckA
MRTAATVPAMGHDLLAWVRDRLTAALMPRPQPLLQAFSYPLLPLPSVLFEQAGAGMLVADRHGRIVRVNAVLHGMVSARADLSPGTQCTAAFAPGEREHVWDVVRAALAGAPPRDAVTTRLHDPQGGADTAVSLSVVTLRESQQKHYPAGQAPVAGVLLRIVDVTLQLRLQAQVVHAQKLQAVGSLAGGIAHDFNNLLTAVLGAAEAIAMRAVVLEPDTIEDLEQIRTSAGRGADLVRQLLAFGRQQTLQPQVLDVNERIADLSGLLRRLLGSAVRLELQLEEPGRRVRADPTQLDQVLVNLAVNARDAMPDGGTLTLRSGHITLYRKLTGGAEVIPPGRYVMIEVEDTGCGIPPEVVPRIFDPFFTTRRERGGNGLGLSTVHGIIRQSEGFLGVESEVGRGTRLRIYLPRFDGEAMRIPFPEPTMAIAAPIAVAMLDAAPATVRAVAADPARSRREVPADAARGLLLLVDDEEPVRRLAERALSRQGWRVLSADCAEQALERLDALPHGEAPVAIVSDMVMPGMDGAALVRTVRARLAMPMLPALLVSGYAEASLRDALASESGVAFLPKPYALKQLTERVAALVHAVPA